MYGNCGEIHLARAAFQNFASIKAVACYNQMLSAYGKNGLWNRALELYHRMCEEGPEPDKITYFIVLGSCSAVGSLREAREIHARIIEAPHIIRDNLSLQNALVNMYGKCGSVEEARKVFDGIKNRDAVSWTSMISSYANNGFCDEALDLYQQMDADGIQPDSITFTSALLACTKLADGKAIHARIVSSNMESDFVGSALINMYARCGDVSSARQAFEKIQNKHVVCWTSLMTAYVQTGHYREALDLYGRMDHEGVHADGVTYVTALGACASLGALKEGKAIHLRVSECGFQSLVVHTALLTMYAKCGELDAARAVFNRVRQKRNVYCWTAMISAYAQAGYTREALELYDQMVAEGTRPNEYTFSNVLAACSSSGDLEAGMKIHGHVENSELASNVAVQNALVTMYAKCGSLELAKSAFEASGRKDLVSWNAMIGAYAQHGLGREALDLYQTMTSQGVLPDEVTIASSLSACAISGSLQLGREIHSRVLKNQSFQSSLMVQTALVNMYGRCGRLETARSMFEDMGQRDVLSWTAMTSVYAQQGHADQVLDLYLEMVLHGIRPNEITFTSILVGCSHAGLLARGVECFLEMQSEHEVVPIREHFLCMVDLLGRSGRLRDAEALVESMPYQPDSVAWLTVLGSCKTHSDADTAKRAARRVKELDPENTSLYSLLSSIFTAAGLPQEALEVQLSMKEMGLKKPPGQSLIEK
ncbi:putative pentatricopeptide repeat-containing protein At1g69350, mitochondrial [Selaginella moellendorffii]|uniref:putative pentatricopeptide repeat-containing protein At1g69350, mitochondrial n=1 Tax=Selaginella moellendorffii TaxID=88036 RepID=UPI000D1CBAA6|nr:putative pentatricopeptide repeat-containing protein At1g69350, mitochondrial [Selaginella moellendorffii]XP_024533716.1 putative pentatricopeptide repeat-containing protein At1g69350, mitochondrial [Selaginella moellendorffii]XP_024533718.1 putative pentatricopeptide repeat-containing protein At1g69350, mitochondrial [Selaginella moellendorffii]XP_024533719.1 putative pentatricopeptide repeat-containing protein At1g69350, mitochondrial [Selaginella moellendorffii]|eukprot:XP_024533715.1 putative pentatricopeptide repeat-containing protein At1g69350, mitochondrial [Selaginella moellendorffii]